MSLILDGTSGVSDIDGSAATPAIRGTDANTGMFFPAADTIAFSEGGVEAMRLDASGNVGIGTSSPTDRLHIVTNGASVYNVFKASNANSTATMVVGVGGSAVGATSLQNNAYLWNIGNSALSFGTNDTERMRIDSSGNLLIGTTSSSTGGVTCAQVLDARTRNSGFGLGVIGNASNTQLVRFAYDTTAVGSINITSNSTSYGTSSDYRLKENIAPMTGALAKVALLKPVTYKWKADGSDGEGFIAHELQEVVPECVVGEKDAVDKDGKPQYQGIDTSFLVATLTAAIQELKAELDSVKAELATLKA